MAKQASHIIVGAAFAMLTGPLLAANRFAVEPTTLLAGSTAQEIPLKLDNDQTILGYSFGIRYDRAVLTVTDVTSAGTIADGADFFGGNIVDADGVLGFGCVFGYETVGTDTLPPGADRLMGVVVADVKASTDTVTTLQFDTVAVYPSPTPQTKNVLTDETGVSLVPTLVPGEVTIETRAPVIDSIAGGSGLAGKVFQVRGQHFDEAGLEVTVCGQVVPDPIVSGGGGTIDVTAPSCASVGCVEVQVCSVRGCDSDPQGFCYDEAPRPPVITTIPVSTGQAGDHFTIEGENFDVAGLAVTVCAKAAVATADPAGTSIDVTAPDCNPGCADVRVCTDDGCTTEVEGFCYTADVFTRGDTDDSGSVDITDGIRILNFLFLGGPPSRCADSMDSNDGGAVDLTDGIYLFNYLFLGGPQPEPPFPDKGADPTPDSLAPCSA